MSIVMTMEEKPVNQKNGSKQWTAGVNPQHSPGSTADVVFSLLDYFVFLLKQMWLKMQFSQVGMKNHFEPTHTSH